MESNAGDMSVGSKARRGIAWTTLAQVIKQASDFGVGILMARLLTPSDFGVVSASMIFLSFVSIMTSFGFSNAIVQRASLEDEFVATTQTLSVTLGCVSAVMLSASAGWISRFFHNPFLEEAIPIMSLIYIISGFNVVPSALLTRKLEFGKLTLISLVGSAIYGGTALSMAFTGFGVWSLIVGPISSLLGSTILVSVASSYMPKFGLKRKCLKEVVHFGGFVTVSSLLNHVARNADNLIIGRYYGAQMLGLYARAYNLATLVKELIVSVFGAVLFPSFARIQQDLSRVRDAYFKSVSLISLLSLPVCVGLLLVAPEFITTVYGKKWFGATRSLQLLSLSGFIYTLYVPCTALLLGLGKVRLYAKLQAAYSLSIVCAVLLAYPRGIEYVAGSVSISIALCFLCYLSATRRLLRTTMKDYWESMRTSLLGTALMTTGVVIIKFVALAVGVTNGAILLFFEVIVAILIYLVYANQKDDEVVHELKDIIFNKISALR
jgi:PST family polysaccharide transporter